MPPGVVGSHPGGVVIGPRGLLPPVPPMLASAERLVPRGERADPGAASTMISSYANALAYDLF